MRKRRLKRKIKFFICVVLILLLIFLFCLFFQKDNQSSTLVQKKDYVSSILSYNNNVFNKDFLEWIKSKYGVSVLEVLDSRLENGNYEDEFWHEVVGSSYIVLQDLYNEVYKMNDNFLVVDGKKDYVSISFAGDVSLADNWAIMPYYNSRKKGVLGILSEGMINYMQKQDFMIVNSEFAFSNRGSAMANKLYTFKANPDNVKVYDEMGVDMVTLANNHVYDYGKDAFLDTLDTFNNASIPYIGAGVNKAEAEDAYYLIINGYKISFLNATRAEKYILTPEALDNSPGVFRCYDSTRLSERIKEEKQVSDYVVVIVHWGKENYHVLEDVQVETGKIYIDSGADMVIGHHAHVLQGVEFYNGKLIAYNLGNFIFNSLNVDTGILSWNLKDNGESEFYFYPGRQKDCYTTEVTGEDAVSLYKKMTEWSVNALFLEDGKIIENNS